MEHTPAVVVVAVTGGVVTAGTLLESTGPQILEAVAALLIGKARCGQLLTSSK
jgi:hypothetical protein